MSLVRITEVRALSGSEVELTLTTGDVVRRDLRPLLLGPVFAAIREDESLFRAVRVSGGSLQWPGSADLCPDVVIWGGMPPVDSSSFAA